MGKLWCFGDSFTAGHGCRPGDEYYDKYSNDRHQIWTKLVAEELGLEEKNLGIPGNSNPNIIKQVLENLSELKKVDTVILSSTLPFRTVLYNNHTEEIAPVTTDIILWPENNPDGDYFIQRYFKNDRERKLLLDYMYTFRMPYEKQWTRYYEKQLCNIQVHLLGLGIKVYFWSHKIWEAPSPFQIISTATKGKIIDGHWSWNGHQDFSNYLLQRIRKQEYLHNPVLI